MMSISIAVMIIITNKITTIVMDTTIQLVTVILRTGMRCINNNRSYNDISYKKVLSVFCFEPTWAVAVTRA